MTLEGSVGNGLYPALEVTGDSIRLLELQPGPRNSIIRANLSTARLSQLPKYEFVSYMWGSSAKCKSIIVNGITVDIRTNLWAFLQKLRYEQDRPRTVWIDAICISQDDLLEKAQQVQMIGEIVKKAEQVLAWLGEGTEGVTKLFSLARRPKVVADLIRMKGGQNSEWRNHLRAFEQCASSPYWSRTWIVQEIMLAQSVVLYAGDDQCDLEMLNHIFNTFALSYGGRKRPRAMRCFWNLIVDRQNRGTGKSLANLLVSYRETQCIDVRDKIYALLSLEERDISRPAIVVDYTIDALTLCFRVEAARPRTNMTLTLLGRTLDLPKKVIWKKYAKEQRDSRSSVSSTR